VLYGTFTDSGTTSNFTLTQSCTSNIIFILSLLSPRLWFQALMLHDRSLLGLREGHMEEKLLVKSNVLRINLNAQCVLRGGLRLCLLGACTTLLQCHVYRECRS
jgi:hypothetical protein